MQSGKNDGNAHNFAPSLQDTVWFNFSIVLFRRYLSLQTFVV